MRLRTPDVVPVLSRGKHRSPRKGACFMEFASYLAGEPWSDHPGCTDPVLAGLARAVNDSVGDEARRRLVPLVPDVVGLVSSRPESGVRLARLAALAALPIAAESRQKVLAVALLRCEVYLAPYDGRPAGTLSPEAADALDEVPHARDWARAVRPRAEPGSDFERCGVPRIIESSVDGIARAVQPDTDERLVRLLTEAVRLSREWFSVPPHVEPVPPPRVRWSSRR